MRTVHGTALDGLTEVQARFQAQVRVVQVEVQAPAPAPTPEAPV